MIFLIFFLICVFITLGIGVLAGISDYRGLIIPNAYSVYVIATFLVAYAVLYLSGQNVMFKAIYWHLLSALVMFCVTFAMFGLKMLGAGDSKFATACALWISTGALPAFVFYMTVMGAVLGVAALVIKNKKPFANPKEGSWIAQVQGGASKVPYGIAIAFGMVIAFIQSGYFSPDLLSEFVAVSTVTGAS